MSKVRPRMSALICYAWTIALFALSAWLFCTAAGYGLRYFLTVLPEWALWLVVGTSVIGWRTVFLRWRADAAVRATRYWYNRSEPRFIGKFVEELCAIRGLQLPWIYIDPNRYPNRATMLDDWQRPDVLRIESALLDILSPPQVEAVLAHELRHSDALDTKLAGVCHLLRQTFTMLWFWGGFAYFFFADVGWAEAGYRAVWGMGLLLGYQFSATLLQLALHRSLEYKADILACMDIDNPKLVVNTLYRISKSGKAWEKTEERPRIWDLLAILERILERYVTTHPTFAQRKRAIESVYGPIEIDASSSIHEGESPDAWSYLDSTLQSVA